MGIFVGIDPGSKGAICLLDTITKDICFKPTPCLNMPVAELYNWLHIKHLSHGIHIIGIEDVHSIQGTSASSNFTFGYNVGQIRAVAEITKIGIDLVTPKAWQNALKIPSKKQAGGPAALKKAIAEVALRLYPHAALFGPKGGLLDGRSDALMIAHYMALKLGGALSQ